LVAQSEYFVQPAYHESGVQIQQTPDKVKWLTAANLRPHANIRHFGFQFIIW
jgi:hypothetical protein